MRADALAEKERKMQQAEMAKSQVTNNNDNSQSTSNIVNNLQISDIQTAQELTQVFVPSAVIQ